MNGSGARALRDMVRDQKRGEPRGIWSVCSATSFVLEAAMEEARAEGGALLVEATSNQVNPEGGYTGQTPADFARSLAATAESAGFPVDRLILGGDHLGPFPWQGEPAATALAKSRELVRQCVLAGYEKIHLDASMACADDPGGAGGALDERTVAERTAELAGVAEAAAAERGGAGPVYVVGTEVPTPGGEQEAVSELGSRGRKPPSASSNGSAVPSRPRAWSAPGSGSLRSWCSPAWSSATTRCTPTIGARPGRSSRLSRAFPGWCTRPTRRTTRPPAPCGGWWRTTS